MSSSDEDSSIASIMSLLSSVEMVPSINVREAKEHIDLHIRKINLLQLIPYLIIGHCAIVICQLDRIFYINQLISQRHRSQNIVVAPCKIIGDFKNRFGRHRFSFHFAICVIDDCKEHVEQDEEAAEDVENEEPGTNRGCPVHSIEVKVAQK